MARWTWLLLLAGACKGGDDGGKDAVGDDDDDDVVAPAGCADRQAWPIDEEGHQLDRVNLEYDGDVAFWWVPENPRGLVHFAHANNKSASTLSTLEHEEFWNELARRNIAYMAVSSVAGGWDGNAAADNVDTQRILGLRDQMIAETNLTADVPMFGVGFSAGASYQPVFANSMLANGVDVRGIAMHNSVGYNHAPVHAIYVSHENDNPDAGASAYQDWLDAGDTATLHALDEEPLDPLRFTRIDSYDEVRSQTWFDELVAGGLVDTDGTRIVDNGMMSDALDAWERDVGIPGSATIVTQMSVVWRLHIFSADASCAVAQGFEDLL